MVWKSFLKSNPCRCELLGLKLTNVEEVSLRQSVFLLLLVLSLMVLGCQKKQDERHPEPQASSGRVEATSAYRAYFGEPPTVPEGVCFAVAGFYPLKDQPGKLMPVPHFTFALTERPRLVLEQVMMGGEPLGMEHLFVNPFPQGIVINSFSLSEGLSSVDFSREILDVASDQQPVLLASLAHTLLQFDEIERIRVTADGQPLPFASDRDLSSVDPALVMEPHPPALLQAFLHDDEDAIPGEMLIFFDRPVTIKAFSLEFPQAEAVRGDYFTSVFDMAVVIHPEDPGRIRVGDEVFISWHVVDGRGREARGEEFYPLGHLSHD